MKTVILLIVFSLFSVSNIHSQNCSNHTTGNIPLMDFGDNLYHGIKGGLYVDGSNTMPANHKQDGIALADNIQALDINGNPDPNGAITFISIGMSNARNFFTVFKNKAETYSAINPKLKMVNAARGGVAIDQILSANDNYWNYVSDTLINSGSSDEQVQVIWIMQATHITRIPAGQGIEHIDTMERKFLDVFEIFHDKFPNLKQVFFSGRDYGGYSIPDRGNPEPYAYYTNWALKKLIQRQIDGDPALAYDGANPKVPWLAWANNLWADGRNVRSDGFNWVCNVPNQDYSDYQSDGVHPTIEGNKKGTQLMMDFFKKDECTNWFVDPNADCTIGNSCNDSEDSSIEDQINSDCVCEGSYFDGSLSLTYNQGLCQEAIGVSIQFTDYPTQTGFEISTDYGISYSNNIPDDIGNVEILLSPGDYYLFHRWGPGRTPFYLGYVHIPAFPDDDGDGICNNNDPCPSDPSPDCIGSNLCKDISSFPYVESFEFGFADWIQNPNNSFDWSLISGTSPTQNTGPQSAFDGLQYIYAEANNNHNSITLIESPCIDVPISGDNFIKFQYHMFGNDVDRLRVAIFDNTTNQLHPSILKLGNQGDQWFEEYIDLSGHEGNNISMWIEARIGDGNEGDIAIDHLRFYSCKDSLQVFNPVIDMAHYQSNQLIQINQPVQNDYHIQMSAGNKIEILGGFEVDLGSSLITQIESCGI